MDFYLEKDLIQFNSHFCVWVTFREFKRLEILLKPIWGEREGLN